MTTIRTYERFQIRWDRGSTWTGYQSEAEAQKTVDYAKSIGGDTGKVERITWEVDIDPEIAHLYRPGVSERTV